MSLKLAVVATVAALSTSAFAAQDTWDINAPNGEPLRVAAGPAASQATHQHASASGVAATNVDRVIVLRPGTKYVNVTNGETVLFKVGDKSFVRKFESMLIHGSFKLSEIAPSEVNVQGIQVYCQPTLYERAG
jgi:Heavy-metal resistance protein CzcE